MVAELIVNINDANEYKLNAQDKEIVHINGITKETIDAATKQIVNDELVIISGGKTFYFSNWQNLNKIQTDNGLTDITLAIPKDTITQNDRNYYVNGTGLNDVINAENALPQQETYRYKNKKKKWVTDVRDTNIGVNISAGAGNDEITGSMYNDTMAGGSGTNRYLVDVTKNFGTDTIILTDGETVEIRLLGDNNPNMDNFIYSWNIEKDLILYVYSNNLPIDPVSGERQTAGQTLQGTLVLKNYFDKNVTLKAFGNDGIELDEGDGTKIDQAIQRELQRYYDELADYAGGNTYYGSKYDDRIDASNATQHHYTNRYKVKKKWRYEEIYTQTGVTIDAGEGDDTITGSKYNDTITGGSGTNTVNITTDKWFGEDIYYLTEGESLILKLTGEATVEKEFIGQNLVLSVMDGTTLRGKVIIANFGQVDLTKFTDKDLKVVQSDGSTLVLDLKTLTNTYNYGQNQTGNYTGTNFNDTINAENAGQYTYQERYKNKKKKWAYRTVTTDIGVTIDGGAGNDEITGSRYKDTIIGGSGNNTIILKDTIIDGYSLGFGDDKIVLSENENLTIKIDHAFWTPDTPVFDGRDLLITVRNGSGIKMGSVRLLGFADDDPTNSLQIVDKNGTQIFDLKNIDSVGGISQSGTYYKGSRFDDAINTADGGIDASFTWVKNKKKKWVQVYNPAQGVTIDAGEGDDTITGSKYDDAIYVGGGNDEVIFKDFRDAQNNPLNFGTDTIYLTNDENLTINLKELNLTSQPTFTTEGDKLYITTTRGTIILANATSVTNCSVTIEIDNIPAHNIDLADVLVSKTVSSSYTGNIFDEEINASGADRYWAPYQYKVKKKWKMGYTPTEIGVTLNGGAGDDKLTGSNWIDTLYGGDGDDELTSGKHNDFLYGGKGDDTFVFHTGDGIDTVYSESGTDTIRFADVNDFSEFILISDGTNLIVKYGEDRVVLDKYFVNETNSVQKIAIGDGVGEKTKYLTTFINEYNAGDGATPREFATLNSYVEITDFNKNYEAVTTNADDNIATYNGNDTVYASKGNDIISLGTGNNKIIYSVHGFGSDTIILTEGENLTIDLSALNLSEVKYSLSDSHNNLIISTAEGDITLDNFASYDIVGYYGKVSLKLSDTQIIDLNNDILEKFVISRNYTGTRLNEYIDASSVTEEMGARTYKSGKKWITVYDVHTGKGATINSDSGNDTIIGSAWDDTITGGTGNDTINGGAGNDTYIFNIGDGNDIIENSEGIDTLVFAEGTELVYSNNNKDLIISYSNSDSVTLKNYADGHSVKYIQVGNNKREINLPKIREYNSNGYRVIEGTTLGETLTGTNSNDIIYSNGGSDIIKPKNGDDIIYCGNDNQTIEFETGSGNDTVYLDNGSQTLNMLYNDSTGNTEFTFSRVDDDIVITKTKCQTQEITSTVYIDYQGNLTFSATSEKPNTPKVMYYDQNNVLTEDATHQQVNTIVQEQVYQDSEGHLSLEPYSFVQEPVTSVSRELVTYYRYTLDGHTFYSLSSNLQIGTTGLIGTNKSNGYAYIINGSNDVSLTAVSVGDSYETIDGHIKYNSPVYYDSEGHLTTETMSTVSNRVAEGYYLDKNGNITQETYSVVDNEIAEGIYYIDYNGNIVTEEDIITDTVTLKDGITKDLNTTNISFNGEEDLLFNVINKENSQILKDRVGDYQFSFNANDGNSTIYTGSGNDTIVFSEPVTLEYIKNLNNNDLIISYGENDSIILKDYYINSYNSVQTIKNGDNLLNISTEISKGITLICTENDDSIDSYGNNIIHLNGGNDTLNRISGTETLVLKDVSFEDISYEKVGNNLVINYGENNSVTLVRYFNTKDPTIKLNLDGNPVELEDKINQLIINGTDNGGHISGTKFNDVIYPKKGTDTIYGYAGSNTYIFSTGDGTDIIENGIGTDTIEFTTKQTNLRFSRDLSYNSNDLIIKYGNNDEIRLKNYYNNDSHSVKTIKNGEEIINVDNETIDSLGLDIKGSFTTGETIIGTSGNDIIKGNGGGDTVYGGDGDDTIYGENGTNTINGGAGNNTYIERLPYFNSGTNIIENGEGTDNIIIYGYNSSNYSNNYVMQRSNNDLIVSNFVLKDYFVNYSHSVKTINGISLESKIAEKLNINFGGKGDNGITVGEAQTDLVFRNGNGNDIVYNCKSTDTLFFADTTLDSLTWTKIDNDLVIGYGDDNSVTLKDYFLTGYNIKLKNDSSKSCIYDKFIYNPQNVDLAETHIENSVNTQKSLIFDLVRSTHTVYPNKTYYVDQIIGLDVHVGSVSFPYIDNYITGGSIIFQILTPGTYDLAYDPDGTTISLDIEYPNELLSANRDVSSTGNHIYLHGKPMAIIEEFHDKEWSYTTITGGNSNNILNGLGCYNSISEIPEGVGQGIILKGGGGDDYIYAGYSNIIQYGIENEGNDIIYRSNSNDVLQYTGNGISTSSLQYEKSGDHLIVKLYKNNSLKSSTKIMNYFISDNPIDVLKINDSTYQLQNALSIPINGDNNSVNNITGTKYRDVIHCGNMGDTVYAGQHNDTINGGSGDDLLYGESGNDIINGNDGNDTIYGGLGSDTIDGGAGNNTYVFSAGDGNDIIKKGSGNDTIEFTTEQTNFSFSKNLSSNVLTISYGDNDSISLRNYDMSSSHSVKNIKNGDTTLTLTEVLDIYGMNITGSTGSNNIIGTSAADTINAGRGNDSINGGAGNNVYLFSFGDGNDIIENGVGNDTISFSTESLNLRLYHNLSNDDLVINYGNSDSITLKDYYVNNSHSVKTIESRNETMSLEDVLNTYSIDIFIPNGSDKNSIDFPEKLNNIRFYHDCTNDDLIVYYGNNNSIILQDYYVNNSHPVETINNGDDTYTLEEALNTYGIDIISSNNADLIQGSDVNDYYIYNSQTGGNDIIVSSAGNDTIIFKAQTNLTYNKQNNDLVINHNWGTINLQDYFVNYSHSVNAITNWNTNLLLNEQLEAVGVTINGTDDNDNIQGSNYNDTINNSAGNDTIYGYGGNDVIYASSGSNSIYGGTGNDVIHASSGTNIIYGETGDDTINLGSGRSTVVFNNGDGSDTVIGGNEFDILKFNDTKLEDLKYEKSGTNLIIKYGDSYSDSVIVQGFFTTTNNKKLSDYLDNTSTILDSAEIEYAQPISAGTLYSGTCLNDFYTVTLDYSTQIYSSKGNDIVYFKDATSEDLQYSLSGKDLVISNIITIKNYTDIDSDSSLNIKTKNGAILNIETGKNDLNENVIKNVVLLGSDDNDVMNTQNDYSISKIVAGQGNDQITLGDKAVEIVLSAGDGTDTIENYKETDKLIFSNSDISTLTYSKSNDDLVINYTEDDCVILKNYFFNPVNMILEDQSSVSKRLLDCVYMNPNDVDLTLNFNNIIRIDDYYNYDFKARFGGYEYFGQQTYPTSVDLELSLKSDSTGGTYRKIEGYFDKKDTYHYETADEIDCYLTFYAKTDNPDIYKYYRGNTTLTYGSGIAVAYINAYADTIIGGNSDNIIVATSQYIIGGKGNDYLYSGAKNLSYVFKFSPGSGHDVIYNSNSNDTLEISTKTPDYDEWVWYEKSGDDMIVHHNDDDTVTIKDYWTTEDNIRLVSVNEQAYFNNITVTINGEEDVENNIVGTSGHNNIHGKNLDDTINGGLGNNSLFGGSGNDTYIVDTNLSNLNTIYDESGSNDTISITDVNTNSLLLYFDLQIDDDGNIVDNLSKDMYITKTVDFGSTTKGIKVTDQFVEGHSIEAVSTADNYTISTSQINALRENIAGWLLENHFESVQQILDSNDSTNINNLITQFQTANWQQIP